jgi:hypothetical protein
MTFFQMIAGAFITYRGVLNKGSSSVPQVYQELLNLSREREFTTVL